MDDPKPKRVWSEENNDNEESNDRGKIIISIPQILLFYWIWWCLLTSGLALIGSTPTDLTWGAYGPLPEGQKAECLKAELQEEFFNQSKKSDADFLI